MKSFKPHVVKLEDRAIPTAGITLAGGVLTIEGTAGNDRIFIEPNPQNATQVIAILQTGSNVTSHTYAKNAVASIAVKSMAGDDAIVNNTAIKMNPDGGG